MLEPRELKGKLDAMTAFAFAVAMADLGVNGPSGESVDWDARNWRAHEGNVRRLRQRIFKAACLSRMRGNVHVRF